MTDACPTCGQPKPKPRPFEEAHPDTMIGRPCQTP